MKWNFDFEISALAFEIVLLIFYFAKRHLPTKKDRYFILAMGAGCFATLMDMVSGLADTYWRSIPLELVHAINIFYFLAIATDVLLLFIYILSVTDQLDVVKTPLFLIYCVPYLLMVIMAIATPYTGALYYFDRIEGYMHGPTYLTHYILNTFYLILAIVYVVVYRSHISKLHLYSIISLIVLLAAGSILQSLFFP